ncbi:MAG TPA: protein kinase [Terriglobales bacterium]|nr:protein kinase [Terriglobales bacterium]
MDDHSTAAHSSHRHGSHKLASGARFGRYHIIAPLGAGGMGEVYRARDASLGRDLAIKILPSHDAPHPHDLERFEREARSASALSHPNIITIFELGQVETTYYIAMELVEGDLLRDLLSSGALPLRKAIPIALQIANGLAKAHEAGITHRDLKPENLMITRDGFVKILDFGLAKLAPSGPKLHESETLDGAQTLPGSLLGTIQYMSPEQANGQPVDFRSDQFSFGLVLYEMITGRAAFTRSTTAEILAAIVRDAPESVAALNPQAPAPLVWVVERCLSKDPKERYASTQDLARDLAAIRDRISEAPSRHAPPRLINLPAQRTAFIGRDNEAAALKDLLLRADVRLVTLTGPGGIGKTRLALESAAQSAAEFPGGICFVSLAAVNDVVLVPSAIAQALGISEAGKQAPLERLKDYLQDVRSPLLILLDNFEHLLAAAPAIAECFSVAAQLKLMVTSRSRLHIYGEHEFPVPPLGLPGGASGSSLAALAKNPAIALFVERAAAIKPSFALTKENATSVAAICSRLDGLPLAIELAAARIKLLSPAAMEARLQSSLQLLTGGAKDLPERQQTLRAAIDWSYGLLNPAEQALFRRLAVFAGGCTLEGAEAVCNTKQDLGIEVLDGIDSLVDKSLVQQIEARPGQSGDDEPRFTMLDTIRVFGLDRLGAAGEGDLTRRAHAAYCVVLAEEFAGQAADPAHTEWVSRFDLEHNNLRAALEYLIQLGNAEWGLRLGAAMFQFWETREHLTEAREWLRRLLALPEANQPTNARARVLFSAGVLAGEQGDYEAGHRLVEESLDICRLLSDTRGVGIALNALGANARERSDLASARSLFEESLSVWRGLADRVLIARALSNLANVVKMQADYALARSLFEECLSIFRELGDRTGMAWSLNYEGDVARAQGELEAARSLYQQSLAIFRQLGDKWGMAGCLADMGNLASAQSDHETARSLYIESMKTFQELGQKRGIARLLDCLACSAAAQSKPERALRLAGAAAALRRVLGAPLPATERVQLEAALDSARRAIPHDLAAAAWMQGWTAPLEEAVGDALSNH